MKASRTSNRRAVANARRSFLVKQKPAPAGPLSHNERSELFDLMDDAHASNHRLLDDDRGLNEAREAFAIAEGNLKVAEASIAQERAENQRIHAKLAPLLHRLTA